MSLVRWPENRRPAPNTTRTIDHALVDQAQMQRRPEGGPVDGCGQTDESVALAGPPIFVNSSFHECLLLLFCSPWPALVVGVANECWQDRPHVSVGGMFWFK